MLEQILKILENHNVFLTGGAGVGKTHLTQAVIKHYKTNSKNVIKLGSTGISAVNIGGVSIHSFFKFGICANFAELASYDKRQKSNITKLAEIIKIANLIIIDEISMVSGDLLEMIAYRLRTLKFQGKLLLVGDFYQLPPVYKKDEATLFDYTYAFNSDAWKSFELKNIELKISKRTKDIKFYEILKSLRLGEINQNVNDYINSLRIKEYELDENVTMLFGRNIDADNINQIMLDRLDTPLEISNAELNIIDEATQKNGLQNIQNWLNSLNSQDELKIKVGAKIIFVVNYAYMGYYNGEQGKIKEIIKEDDKCVSVVIEKQNGEIIQVGKHLFTYTKFVKDGDEINQQILATFSQFPFKLAYAITIHKSQGMSINNLVCNLNQIFANGQLYVALSRATNPENLKLFYNKRKNFSDYLKSVVKIDDKVRKFYNDSKFENFKEIW